MGETDGGDDEGKRIERDLIADGGDDAVHGRSEIVEEDEERKEKNNLRLVGFYPFFSEAEGEGNDESDERHRRNAEDETIYVGDDFVSRDEETVTRSLGRGEGRDGIKYPHTRVGIEEGDGDTEEEETSDGLHEYIPVL
jgi:hypothetical protein